jgi:hypothetical protein
VLPDRDSALMGPDNLYPVLTLFACMIETWYNNIAEWDTLA